VILTADSVHTGRPGDYLKPGEDEIDGLKARLDERLAPPTDSRQFNASHGLDNEWEIGDCLAQWWRPNFETFMVGSVSSICIFFVD
jgi:cleavage and polyadenylation specificity factor subunit 5